MPYFFTKKYDSKYVMLSFVTALDSRNQWDMGSNPTQCVCPWTRYCVHNCLSTDPGIDHGYPAGIYFFQCSKALNGCMATNPGVIMP